MDETALVVNRPVTALLDFMVFTELLPDDINDNFVVLFRNPCKDCQNNHTSKPIRMHATATTQQLAQAEAEHNRN